jgi:hypothetical protein
MYLRLTGALNRDRPAKWIDGLWGYDLFIAHRRADASGYAGRLFAILAERRIACFIDQNIYNAGDSLAVATRRHVSKSTILLLIASPELLRVRRPTDWVEEEISEYLRTHPKNPKIIVIDFGNTISNALLRDDQNSLSEHPIISKIHQFIILPQDLQSLSHDPSEAVFSAIERQLDGRRRDRSRVRIFQYISAALLLLLLFVGALGLVARRQQQLAEERLNEALTLDSRRLAAESKRQLELGNGDLAVALAREALQGVVSGNSSITRPYTSDAGLALCTD